METITIDNKYMQIWLEDGILYNICKPNIEVTVKVAKFLVQERLKVSNGCAYPMLIDMSTLVSADMESRKYLSGEEATHLVTAGAFLMTNPIAKFAGNLFLRINQPKVPARIFTDKKAAIAWLQQFK